MPNAENRKRPFSLTTPEQKLSELKRLDNYIKITLIAEFIFIMSGLIGFPFSLFLVVFPSADMAALATSILIIPIAAIGLVTFILFVWEIFMVTYRLGILWDTRSSNPYFYFKEYRPFLKGQKTLESLRKQ